LKKKFINCDNGDLKIGKFMDDWTFTPQMTINNVGYVGIGKETPFAALDVDGSIKANGGNISGQLAVGGLNGVNATHHVGTNMLRGFNVTDVTQYGTWTTSYFGVEGDGDVGIGVHVPDHILEVKQSSSTDPIADAWTTYSSRRWKTNIETIENALDKVERLEGVSFQWKLDGKKDIGLIAENVGSVIPEVVVYEENGVDAEAVDYARLVALLIEAVKEQQAEIEELKKHVEALQ